MVRRWLASMKLQKQKWGVARTMFLGRIYASRWRKNAQQSAKIKGPNKNLPLVANNADSKQAEKQQRTCADFSQVMSQLINHVLYLFFVMIWFWTCWISTFWICCIDISLPIQNCSWNYGDKYAKY